MSRYFLNIRCQVIIGFSFDYRNFCGSAYTLVLICANDDVSCSTKSTDLEWVTAPLNTCGGIWVILKIGSAWGVPKTCAAKCSLIYPQPLLSRVLCPSQPSRNLFPQWKRVKIFFSFRNPYMPKRSSLR